jgi:hypothetical protein
MNLAYLTDIHNLRKKVPQGFIQTIRGIGYTIREAYFQEIFNPMDLGHRTWLCCEYRNPYVAERLSILIET